MIKTLTSPDSTSVYYIGSGPEAGPLPAFFYFSLSGEESLLLHPYNHPASLLADPSRRIFSFTIPGHEDQLNKHHAMTYWAQQMAAGVNLLEPFFEAVVRSIEWLISENIVNPQKMAVGGLSRGAFVATHIAARIPSISSVLGFAPLTELMKLKEFSEHSSLAQSASALDLTHLVDRLNHVSHLRFYIGNLDSRVDTDACYHFIRLMATHSHEKRVRHQKVELMITQSLGHKGHGTDPHRFEEGATWLKQFL